MARTKPRSVLLNQWGPQVPPPWSMVSTTMRLNFCEQVVSDESDVPVRFSFTICIILYHHSSERFGV